METFAKFDNPQSLDGVRRKAVVDLLFRLADDALVMGHRNSEWTGLGPILEEDIAFSSMAQDEMGHAQVYYQLLHELGEGNPDTLAFDRKARDWKCASLVSLPGLHDWAFSLIRKFLYDVAVSVRLSALMESSYVPLAQVARKLKSEKKFHLMHGRAWVLRLGAAGAETRLRMQAALDAAYPHALAMFEATEADEVLAQTGIAPRELQMRKEWESAVAPVLREAGLIMPDNVRPANGGRVGKHPPALKEMLDAMQVVYQIDPTAKW